MTESRRHRHSRESPFREEIVLFKNAAGITLRGCILSKWQDSPFSTPTGANPHHHTHQLHHQLHHHQQQLQQQQQQPTSKASTVPHLHSTSTLSVSPAPIVSPSVGSVSLPPLSSSTPLPSSPLPVHDSKLDSTTATSFSSTPYTHIPSTPGTPPLTNGPVSCTSSSSLISSPALIIPPLSSSSASFFIQPRVIIICHGMAAHTHWGFLPELSESLLKEVGERISCVFRFDFTGCGGSEGEFDYGGYQKQVQDIAAAVQMLRNKGYAIHALIGHSMGANAVLLYASAHHDIPDIIAISARYKMTRGLPFGSDQLAALQQHGYFMWKPKGPGITQEEVKVTQATINERLSLDMDCVKKIALKDDTGVYRVRVLTVHGNADAIIPVEDAHVYHELIGNNTLRTIDDADHNFTTEQHRLMLITTICEWLCKEPIKHDYYHTAAPLQQQQQQHQQHSNGSTSSSLSSSPSNRQNPLATALATLAINGESSSMSNATSGSMTSGTGNGNGHSGHGNGNGNGNGSGGSSAAGSGYSTPQRSAAVHPNTQLAPFYPSSSSTAQPTILNPGSSNTTTGTHHQTHSSNGASLGQSSAPI